MTRKNNAVSSKPARDVSSEIFSKASNVVDFARYRESKAPSEQKADLVDAEQTLAEIAQHLLMAVQAMKRFYHSA